MVIQGDLRESLQKMRNKGERPLNRRILGASLFCNTVKSFTISRKTLIHSVLSDCLWSHKR